METAITVVRLQIKNFLSISDVDLKPGHITQIVGQNNQGKTSILKAIEVALKGTTDSSVVKIGETQAEIVVEFSDGLNVRRRIKAEGGQDVRVTKNDMEAKAPQGLLNSLFETSAFNPLELLDPKRRTEALLQMIPARLQEEQVMVTLAPLPVPMPQVDFSQHGLKVITQLHDYFYSRRAEANKKAKEEQSRLKVEEEKLSAQEPEKGSHEDNDLDRMSGECDAEIRQLQQKQGENNKKIRDIETLRNAATNTQKAIEERKQEIEDMRRNLAVEEERFKSYTERADKAHLESLEFGTVQPRIDELNGIKTRHASEKTKNANHRTWLSQKNNLDGQRSRYQEADKFASELDRCVNLLRGDVKNAMMAATEMPIPGITYDGEKFLFEGYSVENLSTSLSMKLACALARALAKKTKVVCLDGAESLDEQAYELLKKEIADDGFTYFITKVGDAFRASSGDTVVTMQGGSATQAVQQ